MHVEEERIGVTGYIKPRLRTELTGQDAVLPLSHLMALQRQQSREMKQL